MTRVGKGKKQILNRTHILAEWWQSSLLHAVCLSTGVVGTRHGGWPQGNDLLWDPLEVTLQRIEMSATTLRIEKSGMSLRRMT